MENAELHPNGSCLLLAKKSDCKPQEAHQFAEVAELKMAFGRWCSTGLIAHELRVNRNECTVSENIRLITTPRAVSESDFEVGVVVAAAPGLGAVPSFQQCLFKF